MLQQVDVEKGKQCSVEKKMKTQLHLLALQIRVKSSTMIFHAEIFSTKATAN
jgi:hypothetical protein